MALDEQWTVNRTSVDHGAQTITVESTLTTGRATAQIAKTFPIPSGWDATVKSLISGEVSTKGKPTDIGAVTITAGKA